MGLFNVLNGRIGYFNSIAVPVYNDISLKIRKSSNGAEELFFGLSLYPIASKMIDLFFKPGPNSLIKTIKEYNQNDIRNLYAIFMIWVLHDFINFSNPDNKDELQDKLQNILGLEKDKFNYYFKQFKHGSKSPIGLDKLWRELIKIIHSLPDTQENYLVFTREFSKICREAYQKL